MNQPQAIIVIPCFNEANRLALPAFQRYTDANPQVTFLFVNDGSTDTTGDILDRGTQHHPRMQVLHLPSNCGKAEAVRQGMLAGLATGCPYVGFWDADLATPLEEIERFLLRLEKSSQRQIVLGCRHNRLGVSINRRPMRHYIGRVFATLVANLLNLQVYDTQCGAKVFRNSPSIVAAFASPFRARWVFDVEILARLKKQGQSLETVAYEEPLQRWNDVAGSKLTPAAYIRAAWDLLKLFCHMQMEPNPAIVTPTVIDQHEFEH